ncbi:MAG: 30S ribosomal protein S16 [Bacillota bacterium]
MAVRIRLRRLGGKKDAFYRIVVADSRSPRDGRFIEEIGYYDPVEQPAKVKIDVERARHWLGRGAKPSETVRDLLRRARIIGGFQAPEGEEESPIAFELVGEVAEEETS